MKTSRKILTISALLALTAWANVQVMACCWLTGNTESSKHVVQAYGSMSMAEDHSCCPGEESEASQPPHKTHSTSTPCGMEMDSHPAICCNEDASSGELTASLSNFSFPQLILATLMFLPFGDERLPGLHSESSGLSVSSGPPRYLSLQRILI